MPERKVNTESKAYKKGYADGKDEAVNQLFKEILILIRTYEHSAMIAKNDYGIFQVRNFGTDILKLKEKYKEED